MATMATALIVLASILGLMCILVVAGAIMILVIFYRAGFFSPAGRKIRGSSMGKQETIRAPKQSKDLRSGMPEQSGDLLHVAGGGRENNVVPQGMGGEGSSGGAERGGSAGGPGLND